MKCLRPDCKNELHSGAKYCSTKCNAMDRKRIKAERAKVEVVQAPKDLITKLEGVIGSENTALIISEVNRYMLEEKTSIPLPLTGQTYGDLVLSYDGTKEYRPSTTLSFDVIDKMLRSGPVVFALEMKRAQVYRVFSGGRYKVISPDKELAEVAEAALKLIMPKMMHDVTWSAFAYGTSFSEEVWEWKTKEQLGIVPKDKPDVPGSDKEGDGVQKKLEITPPVKEAGKFLVPKVPNAVNPSTVDHIKRTKDGAFDGFVQKRKVNGSLVSLLEDPIEVDREQALVIPINEHFRNLWGESTLKPMYILWLWYEIVFRTMVRYMDRMAIPWKVATAPARQTVTVSGSSQPVRAMDLALALAANLDKSGAVAIPSDVDENGKPLWDLKLLTAESRVTLFLEVLQYLGQEMIRAALSADRALSQSSGGVGSYNIGEVHAAASAVTSEMLLLQILHYLNMYFMPEFSLYNRGVEGPPIWLRTQSIDTSERDMLMSLIGVAGNSPAAQELFYMVDWRTLLETSNIPALTQAEVEAMKEKLTQEAEDKMEKQQEIMAKNKAPVPTGGASAFADKNAQKPATPAPSNPDGTSPTKKAEEDNFPLALENIFQHQIPWMLGEHEAQVLYDNGLVSDEVVRLFNPFHDGLGRFASKSFSAFTPAMQLYDAHKQAKAVKLQEQIDADLLAEKEYQARYNSFSEAEKKFLVPPAKYLAQKKGLGPTLARGGIDFAGDIATRRIVMGLVYGSAYMLGVTGAAALGISGAIPLSVAGIAVGVGTSFAIAHMLNTAKDNLFLAYMNQYAPTGSKYVTMSIAKQAEKRGTSRKLDVGMVALDWLTPIDNIAVLGLEGFATFGSIAGSAGSSPLYGLEDDYTEADNDFELLMAALYPHVCDLIVNKNFKIVLPETKPGLDQIGFRPNPDGTMVMDATTTYQFVNVWNSGKYPTGKLELGNVTHSLEAGTETIQLFNPNHDNMGRFASKSGTVIATVGIVSALGGAAAKTYADYKLGKGASPTDKVISTKIAGKEFDVTYGQLERGGVKAAQVGVGAIYLGVGLHVLGVFSSPTPRSRTNPYPNKPQKEDVSSWPQARQDEFKTMYRTLSKKYHPDLNRDMDTTEIMQQINNMKDAGNFEGLAELFVKLEIALEEAADQKLLNQIGSLLGLLVVILEVFLDSEEEYLTFPVKPEDKLPDFMIIEDGELVLDKPCAQVILEALEAVINAK